MALLSSYGLDASAVMKPNPDAPAIIVFPDTKSRFSEVVRTESLKLLLGMVCRQISSQMFHYRLQTPCILITSDLLINGNMTDKRQVIDYLYMSTRDSKSKRTEIGKENFIPVIISFLAAESSDWTDKGRIVATLYNLAVDKSNLDVIFLASGIDFLLGTMKMSSDECLQEVARALALICFNHRLSCERVALLGGIQIIIELLNEQGHYSRTKALLASLLNSLATDANNCTIIGKYGGIEALVRVISNGDDECVDNAAEALWNLTVDTGFDSNYNRDCIVEAGGIEILLDWLRNELHDIRPKEHILLVLTSLTCKEDIRERIQQTVPMKLLVNLLKSSDSAICQANAARMITSILSPTSIKDLFSANGIEAIVELLHFRNGNEHCRLNALYALKEILAVDEETPKYPDIYSYIQRNFREIIINTFQNEKDREVTREEYVSNELREIILNLYGQILSTRRMSAALIVSDTKIEGANEQKPHPQLEPSTLLEGKLENCTLETRESLSSNDISVDHLQTLCGERYPNLPTSLAQFICSVWNNAAREGQDMIFEGLWEGVNPEDACRKVEYCMHLVEATPDQFTALNFVCMLRESGKCYHEFATLCLSRLARKNSFNRKKIAEDFGIDALIYCLLDESSSIECKVNSCLALWNLATDVPLRNIMRESEVLGEYVAKIIEQGDGILKEECHELRVKIEADSSELLDLLEDIGDSSSEETQETSANSLSSLVRGSVQYSREVGQLGGIPILVSVLAAPTTSIRVKEAVVLALWNLICEASNKDQLLNDEGLLNSIANEQLAAEVTSLLNSDFLYTQY